VAVSGASCRGLLAGRPRCQVVDASRQRVKRGQATDDQEDGGLVQANGNDRYGIGLRPESGSLVEEGDALTGSNFTFVLAKVPSWSEKVRTVNPLAELFNF
jgi:hypothetical protein